MTINSLKMLSYVGAALKTILHFCYNRFNPAVLEKSQNMLFTMRNNGLYIRNRQVRLKYVEQKEVLLH